MHAAMPSCILHLDCDCFYAQVEARRLNVPEHEPLAVVQWQGLIAVNYAARAYGIKRGMRVAEALQKCPGLHVPHVALIGGDDRSLPDRQQSKVSLDRYRHESVKIFALLEKLAPRLERVSIDEAYIDATDLARAELAREGAAETFARAAEHTRWEAWQPDAQDPFDLHLVAAAAICARLRGAVLSELGYALSAGIAHTKMIAKLASARHKPNQQTIVPRAHVPALLAELPLRDVRGLGGLLGERVAAAFPGVRFAGELSTIPLDHLKRCFGHETALWLEAVASGRHDEPVRESLAPKSLNACKSFGGTSDEQTLRRWLGLIADELVDRMAADSAAWCRTPRRLRLQFRGALAAEHRDLWVAGRVSELTREQSCQCALPTAKGGLPSAERLVGAAVGMLLRRSAEATEPRPRVRTEGGQAWPYLTRIALSVCDFEPMRRRSVLSLLAHQPSAPSAASTSVVCTPAAAATNTTSGAAAIVPPLSSSAAAVADEIDEIGEIEGRLANPTASDAQEEAAEDIGRDRGGGSNIFDRRTAGLECGTGRGSDDEGMGDGEASRGVVTTGATGAVAAKEGWMCAACTFFNMPWLDECEMCDAPRLEMSELSRPQRAGQCAVTPAGVVPESDATGSLAPPQPSPSSGWSCAACTFRNDEALRRCEMCEALRPRRDAPRSPSQRPSSNARPRSQSSSHASGGKAKHARTTVSAANSIDAYFAARAT